MSLIYIADDDLTNRYYIEKILTKAGYEVHSYKNGRELLEAVKVERPELIITDINMPMMDGFEVVLEIRKIDEPIVLPVIATSATYKDISSKLKGYDTGVNDYLTVPFESEELLAKVKMLLQVRYIHKELMDREQKLRTIFATLKDNIFEIDYEGRYLFIAPSSEEFLYKPKSELMGKTLHDIFPVDLADMFLEFIRKSFAENTTVTMEYNLTINGKDLWFEGRATPKTDKIVVFIARNITKYKQALEELTQNRENLENIVQERTKTLEKQRDDLQHMNKLFVGREFRIKELKDKIKELKKKPMN